MFKDLLVFIVLIFMVGCSVNVEDSNRTVSSSHAATGIKGVKITKDIFSNGDIEVKGDSGLANITVSAEISQLVLQNESPAPVNIYLEDIQNGNRKVAFKTSDNDWQGISIGKISSVMPENIALDLSTSSGDVVVSGMTGTVSADVSSGDVDITTKGVVNVDALSGDVEVTTEDGCTVDALSGDVKVKSIGKVTVDASSGKVVVYTIDGCKIDGRSGDVKVTIEKDSTSFSGIDIDASSGDVQIQVPANFSAYLDLEVTSGDITVKNSDVGDDYDGALNDGEVGERVIKVKCTSGDISVIEF